mgnify:CR=1 FL=1
MRLADLFEAFRPVRLEKAVLVEGISHPEDLVFDLGSAGAKRAIDELAQLEKNADTITIKWDGFPALIWGRDASGNLVIADKHMFDKIDRETGKRLGMTTSSAAFQAYDTARGADRSDLWDKERLLRPALEKIIPNTASTRNKFYFGDLLWAGKLTPKAGYFTFTPNTVTYRIKEDSDIGRKIAKSVGGIAVHSFIPGLGEPDEPIKGTGGLPEDAPVVFMKSEMDEKPDIKANAQAIAEAYSTIQKYGAVADKFIQELTDMKAKGVLAAMKTFITKKIAEGNFDNLDSEFLQYLPGKLTSEKAKEKLLGNGEGFLYTDGAAGVNAVWKLWASVVDMKMQLKQQIDKSISDPRNPIQAFTGDDPGHEGYVVGAGKDKLKLIDRLGFSRANFAKTRTDPKAITDRSKMPLAAFCFGRMNPPTLGHKKLMDTTASAGGNNTFIFLSSKQGLPDDPLDYKTKLAFAKKMFPEHAAQIVDAPVTNPIFAANYLYDKGFRNMVFVAGEDRLGSAPGSIEKLLRNWNSGAVRSTDHARGPSGREEVVLNFQSSGARDPDAAGVEGFSASKARAAAKAGDEKQFETVTGVKASLKVMGKSLYEAVRAALHLD